MAFPLYTKSSKASGKQHFAQCTIGGEEHKKCFLLHARYVSSNGATTQSST
jgi:hypothetical protein